MSFAHPYLLLLLLLLPLLAWLQGRRGSDPAFLYSSVRLLDGLSGVRRSSAGAMLAALQWLGLAILIIALAQPRLMHSQTSRQASGVDIVVALDLSGSMVAEDFEIRGERINRLDMAKQVLNKFIENRPNDRIGLVVFATDAYTAAPLTLDHDFLRMQLERMELGVINPNATAIGSGLSTAVNRLRELESKSKIVVLLTDGVNNSGEIEPLAAAAAARALGVKVYTVGVGTHGHAPVPVYFMGQKTYRMQPVDIDEPTLKAIADKTGGRYYRADNAERFREIYEEIDQLEKTDAELRVYTRYRELFAWFIAIGMAVFGIQLVLDQTVWRRLP